MGVKVRKRTVESKRRARTEEGLSRTFLPLPWVYIDAHVSPPHLLFSEEADTVPTKRTFVPAKLPKACADHPRCKDVMSCDISKPPLKKSGFSEVQRKLMLRYTDTHFNRTVPSADFIREWNGRGFDNGKTAEAAWKEMRRQAERGFSKSKYLHVLRGHIPGLEAFHEMVLAVKSHKFVGEGKFEPSSEKDWFMKHAFMRWKEDSAGTGDGMVTNGRDSSADLYEEFAKSPIRARVYAEALAHVEMTGDRHHIQAFKDRYEATKMPTRLFVNYYSNRYPTGIVGHADKVDFCSTFVGLHEGPEDGAKHPLQVRVNAGKEWMDLPMPMGTCYTFATLTHRVPLVKRKDYRAVLVCFW